ncbi:Ger(x)C family spore germination protein [Paenibacillus allorhizosphaerae]|uniref:Spore germination protein A3 n=1 Tax=Paenibacillus allorhizosphaerae TaxID=2849866 RepID=A0ABN7TMA3_9BACL|nr:Ger(x)C family spore germination protein [Paenibacillus allorhizosphaerae]CAG7646894.1 Spore germination protein A3 [Paenibacillus allorhizosphaerae]
MCKPTVVCCLLIVVAAALSGCWDRRELNDLAIAVGLGLDKQENNIRVTTQIVNPGEVATKKGMGGYSTPVSTFSATEPTIFEAIRRLTTIAPRKILSSHLQVLVIGEALARQGIAKVMDGISRNHEFRSDFYLVIAKGDRAENILQILTPVEKIPASKMFNSLEISEKAWAPTVKMPLDKFISDLSSPTKDTVLTGVRITGAQETGKTKGNMNRSVPHANLQYAELALFKRDKLIDWLSEQESKGYNYIMGNVKSTIGHLSCPRGGAIAVEVIRTKSKIKGKVEHGIPKITIDLYVEQDIAEVLCSMDVTKTETIDQLENISKKTLAHIVQSAITVAKKNKADIFGFGEAIEDADPKAWTEMKKDWDRRFADLDVEVRVEVQIRRLGTTNNSLMEEGEE